MRRLATVAFSFSAAMFLSQYFLPKTWLIYCFVIFAATSLIGLFLKGDIRRRFFLIFLGLAAGFLWSFIYISVYFEPAETLNGKTEAVSAVVCTVPDTTDYGSKVVVSVRIDGCPSIKTLLHIYGRTISLQPGNAISFTGRFKLADTFYGERTDSFISQGIYLSASLKGDLQVTDTSTPFIYSPNRVAAALKDKITQIFPPDTEAFMRALLIGDTSGIYEDTTISSALSSTGATHIVSVSGMNIAFLIGLLSLLIKKKRLLATLSIPVIVLFMAVVGFSPSVTRAGIMQIFLLSAPLFKREGDSITSLSASLAIILLVNPFSAGSVGLQLSFSATLGIILFTERIFSSLNDPLHDKHIYTIRPIKAALQFVFANFATTIGALIFSVPLIAIHFGSVSLIAPLTNLLILWAVTLAFCGGVFAVVFGFIFLPIASALAFLAALPVRYIEMVIVFCAHVPFASVYTENTAIVIWLVYVYLMFIAMFLLRVNIRQLLYPVCLAVLSLCAIVVATSLLSDNKGLSVTALDVGQGQSIVLSTENCTAVIDCGSSSGKDAGDILTRYLQSHGKTKIDLLILTHFHTDHANGVMEILERTPVSAIAIPDLTIDDGLLPTQIVELAQAKGIEIITVTQTLTVTLDSALIRLYAPVGSADENERGLSVLCSEGDFDTLITGDMSSVMERRLLSSVKLPDIELLLIGHHGSKNSTSDELLNVVKPEVALISVGYNTYGHPAQETLNKLASFGCKLYRTDQSGNITISAG